MRYSDEHMNYWGDIYCRAQLWEYDLPFAVFLRNPWKYLNEFGVNDPDLPTISQGHQASAPSGSVRRMPGTFAGQARIFSLAEARARRDARVAAETEATGHE